MATRGLHHGNILNRLCYLPRKMLTLHGNDNITEFVLCELCHPECFNLKRAAYFVDSPDFNYLKGVAGFSRDEKKLHVDDIWQDPHGFSSYMHSSPFNQKVRSVSRESLRKKGVLDTAIVETIASTIGLSNHQFHTWDMKYDNHGLFIYEPAADKPNSDLLRNGLCLLSFCPIF